MDAALKKARRDFQPEFSTLAANLVWDRYPDSNGGQDMRTSLADKIERPLLILSLNQAVRRIVRLILSG